MKKYLIRPAVIIAFLFLLLSASRNRAQTCITSDGSNFSGNISVCAGPWGFPTRAQTSNNMYSSADVSGGACTGNLLASGFNFSAIPSGAVITGIEVNIEKKALNASGPGVCEALDMGVNLLPTSHVPATTDHADLVNYWPTGDTPTPYGNSTDLWGSTWTVAEIKSSDFGVYMAAQGEGGVLDVNTVQVDYITITVCYNSSAPVELIEFKAAPKESGVDLEWSVTSETKFTSFLVERHGDSKDFEKIGEVMNENKGNTSLHYTFTDFSPEYGKNFYRIKCLDANGNESVSNTLEAEVYEKGNRFGILNLHPNPAHENITLTISIPENTKSFALILTDHAGRVIRKWKYDAKQTKSVLNVDVSGLKQGLYFFQIKYTDVIQTVKFMWQQ